MRKKMLVSLCLVAAALVTLGAADSCTAPMDATGDYKGTWSFEVTEGEGEEATTRRDELHDMAEILRKISR